MRRDPFLKFVYTTFLFVFVIAASFLYYNKFFTAKKAEAQTEKPNIVVIVTDDQSYESLQAMPYVNGRTDWVRFDNFFLNVPLCCPSRATLLTGQYAHKHGVVDNKAGKKFNEATTLPTWLKAAGYKTSLVGKYLNAYPWNRGNYIPVGWDYWTAITGPPAYYNYSLYENGTVKAYGSSPEDYVNDVLKAKALDFLQTTTPNQPFFLYFSPYAPHRPSTPAPRHKGTYSGLAMIRRPNFNEADVSDKPAWVKALPLLTAKNEKREDTRRRNSYEALLAVDEGVKAIFDSIEAKGLLDNTIFMFIGDNGYSFGEHRLSNKICVYEECVRSVFLVKYPGIEGKTVSEMVSNVDIATSLVEWAGLNPTVSQNGLSLTPLLDDTTTSWREDLLLEWDGNTTGIVGYWAIRTEQSKYVELITGEKEFYDLANDTFEMENKINDPSYADEIASLSARLSQLKAE